MCRTLHLLDEHGQRVLMLLPISVKVSAADVAVDLQLAHAEPKDAAGFVEGMARRVGMIAVIAE